MNLDELQTEMRRLSDLLDKGLTELRKQVKEYADAERVYRKSKPVAWLKAPEGLLAKQKEDWVAAATADERWARDLAEGMKVAATEAVRSRRSQISAGQSYLAAYREEIAMDRTGPR